jgi:hypothetical protein
MKFLSDIDVDQGSEVLLGSGEYLSWGTAGVTSIEGSTTSNRIRFYTSSTLSLTLDSSQNATFAGDVTVSGGDITLGGTGRIQGIDTVSATTDAANKAYVDAVNVGVTQITAGTNVTISPSGGTGNVTINASGGSGGGIGGSITSTQVAYGSGTSNEITGDSTFFYDALNGLTIGNAALNGTNASLTLNKGPAGQARIRLESQGVTALDMKLDGSEDAYITAANDLTIDCSAGNDITMATSSTSGVGIGSTGITKKLQVNGTIYSEQISGEVMIAGNNAYANKYITIREGSNYAARWGLQAEDNIVTSGVMLMTSAKPMAFRSSTNIAFDTVSSSHLIIRASSTNGSANVGIGTDDPQSKLQVAGGIQMGTDTAADNISTKAGTLRYREDLNIGTPKASNSYVDMYMRTDDSSYEWVNIVTSNW